MMDTVEQLKAEAAQLREGQGAWRENEHRLIWCGRKGNGFVFHNTTSATHAGPIISEKRAAEYLASGGPWMRPSGVMAVA